MVRIEADLKLYKVAWWFHVALVLGFFCIIPKLRIRHILLAIFSASGSPDTPMGKLRTITMEEVEETELIGVRLLGGLILQSYWLESYVELLWLSARARGSGLGSKLLEKAEALARRRGGRLIHLNTFSFQAPGFYAKQGYRRFGGMEGSPEGASRHFYVKRLSAT